MGIKAKGEFPVIKVGLEVSPPFVIREGGQLSGLGMDLWQQIADSRHIKYSIHEYELEELLKAIEMGEVEIAISPLTVTSSRIKRFSFSQPYYITNLAYAMKKDKDGDMIAFLLKFFTLDFFKAVFSLFLVILIFGLVVWLFEKRRNPKQFRKGIDGIGDGIWWSAVTMSTVGYGDKSPVTLLGRILSIIWIFTGVIVISGLTAGISSSLTVNQLSAQINSLDDLRKFNVGSVPSSGTADFLNRYKIKFSDFNTVEEGLKAVEQGKIKAFVFDNATLSYGVSKGGYDEVIKVIPSSYFKEYFSFASADDELLKLVNESLIEIIESKDWELELKKYNIEYDK